MGCRMILCVLFAVLCFSVQAQQVSNSDFEDWSAAAFNGEPQPKGWNASNVEQFGFKFNFAHKESGHNGGTSLMVQDQEVGAAGITETSPGYAALGQPWAYVPGLTSVSKATAGTSGGINWTYRPDTMSVWVRRTGSNWSKEDFYLLYYAWSGTAKSSKYKNKNSGCTEVDQTNEESDVRLALNGNECGTDQKATQVAEGMWRERAEYGEWTNIRVPILYMNSTAPTMMNIIFSASNYPNFRANTGLYAGNSLYVDDLELIYSSKIQELWIGGKKWNGFDPNSSEVQSYSLGKDAKQIPDIEAIRGAGTITNAKGTTVTFPGRTLSGSEINVTKGDMENKPTVITVKSGDGKSTTTYKIQFQQAASTNAKLAGIAVNDAPLGDFSPSKFNYTYELPYGTTAAPVVSYTLAEDGQKANVTQATSATGKATIVVTAADNSTKETYTIQFSVGKLKDNTLQDILVNGKSIPGFTPTQTVYKVSLPTNTTSMPEVKGVSAYPAGEQTIVYTAPSTFDGGVYQISVSTPGNPTPKVYKLNLKVEESSYSYLEDLKITGSQIASVNPAKDDDLTAIDFVPENTTYYVNLKMGTTTLPEISYTSGDEFQTITKEEGGLDGTTRITVVAGNKSDQTVYKIVFSTAKSEISTLLGIEIGGKPLEGFQPDVTNYDYVLPVGTTVLPEIKPIAHDEFQEISVTTGGVNGRTRISVTAGNGSTTNYYINFSVSTYTDNHLKSLAVKGYDIGFEPDKNEYSVNLPQGTTVLPEVTYELNDPEFQTADVRPLTNSLNGDYKIIVRPVNGASRTYVIHFSVAVSGNTKLAMIYIDGEPLEGFDPDINDYTYSLPEGVTTIPAVTYDKGDEAQLVSSVLDKRVQRITVTAQSGAQQTYTITFKATASTNSKLNMIYVDGDSLEGFNPEVLNYSYTLKGDVCPPIRVDQAPGQQVTITAPYAAGIASIYVKPGEGETNVYTIDFIKTTAVSTRLKDILVDGVSVEGFDPLTTHYAYVLPEGTTTMPTVTYVKDYEEQKVEVLWKNSGDNTTAYLYVTDTLGNKGLYDIAFSRTMSANAQLADLLVDGVSLEGFDPAVKDYVRSLEPGSTYPSVGYVAANEAQTVMTGQLAEGKWGVTVIAEDDSKEVYTIQFTIQPYTDATLLNMEVAGYDIAFEPNTFEYALSIDEGRALPQVNVTAREGQRVVQYNADEKEQRVVVYAEDGTTKTYAIHYTRVKSNNALLQAIYVDGKELLEFRPDSFSYSIPLPSGTKVVPNVYPVGQMDSQTITTTFGKPNTPTTIVVLAQDGVSTKTYTIDFPVAVSTNTRLKSLDIDGFPQDVNETDFVFALPYGASQTYDVAYEKAEDGQLIEYISAPVTGITKIIVTAENGDKRTYSIRYSIPQPEGANEIRRIVYEYKADNNTFTDTIESPSRGEHIVDLPYGATEFNVTHVVKNYDEQSVIFYNGGIRRGAKIIAVANREGAADAVYTVVPRMPEYKTAGKLKSLRYRSGGVWHDVPNFRPDVYNYIIDVETAPTGNDIEAIAYDDKEVIKSTPNAKLKQITLTVKGGDQYSVCWFYNGDDAPFTFNWIPTESAMFYESSLAGSVKEAGKREPTGYKPEGWTVPADLFSGFDYDATVSHFVYYTGKEVNRISEKEALLSTIRGGALNSSSPGVMTLGSLSLPDGVQKNGGTKFSFARSAAAGKIYRNTPEAFEFEYLPIMRYSINTWNAWIALGDGTNEIEHDISGTYDDLGGAWRKITQPLSYNFTVQNLNILLCASEVNGNSLSIYDGSESKSSDLQVRNVRMVYNSELTKATVNGKGAQKDGNVFTYTLTDKDVILGKPTLKFTKKTPDQAQVIEWLHDGEWKDGELTARVINYGENSKDSTHYYVVLKRAPVEDLSYDLEFASFPQTVSGDTTYVEMPYGTKKQPEVTITPHNIHQRFDVSKSGNTLTIIVVNEKQEADTAVYVFRENLHSDAVLDAITAEDKSGNPVVLNPAFAPETTDYTVDGAQMPILSFFKKGEGDGAPQAQTVDLKYTATGASLKVTAEDGVTTKTYTITLNAPTVATSGQIKEFTQDDIPWDNLGGSTYTAEGSRPQSPVLFTRQDDTDDVVFVQTPTYMEWQVTGSVSHTYKLTYPSSQSNNAKLAQILVNGEPMSDFDPDISTPMVVYADSTTTITVVPADLSQQLTMNITPIEGGVEYQTTVTAEDSSTKSYTVRVVRTQDLSATLAGIYVDDEVLDGFDPNTSDYTVILPAPQGAKTALPRMPSIRYVAGSRGQTITLTPGEVDGDETKIIVTNETNTDTKEYLLAIEAEKSHCSDLTGIVVNGEAIDQFEAGRHYYSVSSKTQEVEIDYMADDRFLKVTQPIQKEEVDANHDRYTLHVVAEDGTSTDYIVDVFIESLSSDAQLANILLDNEDFRHFQYADINPALGLFEPGQNEYHIYIPYEAAKPMVSAVLKEAGQTVTTNPQDNAIFLDVKAADGTPNTYKLYFEEKLSTNANLRKIEINSVALENFQPTTHFYTYELPMGQKWPEIKAEAEDNMCDTVMVVSDTVAKVATITVVAQDTIYSSQYTVSVTFRPSEADTLEVILENELDTLPNFDPHTYYYTRELPVGSVFPTISYGDRYPGDNKWPQIDSMTVEATEHTRIHQTHVTAQSGKKNTYTISYTLLKSNVDTLQMIFVDDKQLPDFSATETEYYYTLSADKATELGGKLPTIDIIQGDEYQTVVVSQTPDSLSVKSLGYKHLISVTAATGAMRTYIIHYPVELSSDATLNMIMLENKPLTNFDSERSSYKVELPMGAVIPVVSVVKKEDAQIYEIYVEADTVRIDVWAEDGTPNTYTLVFEYIKSDVTKLNNIVLKNKADKQLPYDLFYFHTDTFEYTVVMPYDSAMTEFVAPQVEVVKADTLQTVEITQQQLSKVEIKVLILVTAANGIDEAEYSITFRFTRNNDALLSDIRLRGESIEDFDGAQTDYTFTHPFGSDSTAYYTIKDVEVVTRDPRASYAVEETEDGVIEIRVVAQDEKTENTYRIFQKTGKDNCATLKMIMLDSVALEGFDPEVTFYTYQLREGSMVPAIEAVATSERAIVEDIRIVQPGDTCAITCIAEDETTKIYRIHFKVSEINDALTPTSNDMLIKRMPGTTQLFVATIRKGVSFALYDNEGHLVSINTLEDANPNDVQIGKDAQDRDVLLDVTDTSSGMLINVNPNQIYFYSFIEKSGSKKVKSGKVLFVQ